MASEPATAGHPESAQQCLLCPGCREGKIDVRSQVRSVQELGAGEEWKSGELPQGRTKEQSVEE